MFPYLNDILFDKKGDKLSNVDNEQEYNIYMINRWVSMYTPDVCNVVNSTVNWLYPIFERKADHYSFLLNLLPKCRRKFIPYIKKARESDNKRDPEEIDIKLLCKNLELSEREVKYLLEQKQYNECKYRSNSSD
jgi:hypothetical protein